ncbi:hypothetical protein [Burkholderia ambifaria]|uniref:hypothetical protein n=1 Tax=Burkholderia ambifaria TaxID=152480 RepID=UPI001ABA57F8|nr:hypothetical protein [Burkholderia ambifaria]
MADRTQVQQRNLNPVTTALDAMNGLAASSEPECSERFSAPSGIGERAHVDWFHEPTCGRLPAHRHPSWSDE